MDRNLPKHPAAADDDSELAGFGFEGSEADWLTRLRSACRPRVLGHVGGYELLEEIGQGAQGIVFRARQPNTKRDVALKRLAAGSFATPAMRMRFEREVEAAAALHHPNIVTVYGLEYLEGQPVLAMEWVDGAPIDQAILDFGLRIADSRPAIQRVLRIFLSVCDAVQHAHQRGVIHRDLKPTNVLVDAAGEPRVLDFGLAKLIAEEGAAGASATWTRGFVGTPAYASPEQIRGDWRQVDVRSDVYALGVMLYQLLTGRLPYPDHDNLAEVLTAREHARPPRPSAVNPSVGRELDAIVLKTIESDALRRYPSVEALKADLGRYLSGAPVLAHPPSAGYQLRKWVGRHRLASAFVVTVAVLVTAFSLTAGLLAIRLSAERTAAIAARDREAAARATAEEINRFLRDMLAAPDPAREGPAATLRDVLGAAAGNLESGAFGNQPLIEAELRSTLGRSYLAMGLYPEAEPHLVRSVALRRTALNGSDATRAALAAGLHDLAGLRHKQADFSAAEPFYQEALDLRRAVAGGDDSHAADILGNLGELHVARGDWSEAEPSLQRAVEILRASPRRGAGLAAALENQGRLRQAQGDLDGAELALREALDVRRELYGPEHFEVGKSLTSVALLLQAKGDLAGAESMLADALSVYRKVFGPDHPEVATLLSNQAVLLQAKENPAGAEPLVREALAIRRARFGPDHPEVARTWNNLGGVVKAQGEFAAAETHYHEALEIFRQSFSEDHPDVTTTLNNLAAVFHARESFSQAESLYRQVLESRRRTLDAQHPHLAISLNNLAQTLADGGAAAEAEPLLREALAIQRAKLPPDHPHLSSTLVNLGAVLLETDQAAEAEGLLREGLDIRRKRFPESHWLVANPKTMLGACRARQGAYEEAEALLLEGYEHMAADAQTPAPRRRAALDRLIRLYEAWGRPEQAEVWRVRG